MNSKQESILSYLVVHEGRFVSPTEVGMKVGGYPYEKASSWASSTLKRMTAKNWVLRSTRGHYASTQKGLMALRAV